MAVSSKMSRLVKLDLRVIPLRSNEVRAFVCVKNENLRLPFLLDYHRKLGVHRFLFIDNGSTDGTREYLLSQQDCHLFSCAGNFFAENTDPPIWSNALRNVFGHGHWCLTLDADEMFVYPDCEDRSIESLCSYLDNSGSSGLEALVVDMYNNAAIEDSQYRRGESFLEWYRYFDPDLGYSIANNISFPRELMFSKFRERAFWTGSNARQRPPCITQIPLVKWTRGMAYQVCIHSIEHVRPSELRAGILHFKFLPGFLKSIVDSLDENSHVAEKGLEERKNYVDTLSKNPKLSLYHRGSVEYRDSRQLVELGWLRTSAEYENHRALVNQRLGAEQ